MQITGNQVLKKVHRCSFATNERLNTGSGFSIFVENSQGEEFSGSRMLEKAISILLVLLPLIFGEETFECCPLKEVQGTSLVIVFLAAGGTWEVSA